MWSDLAHPGGPLRPADRENEAALKLHPNALVVVADGGKLNLFENTGAGGEISLKALPHAALEAHSGGSGGRHHDTSAEHAHGQVEEDDFAAAVAAHLDTVVAAGATREIVLVAAPKTLGELRRRMSKAAAAAVVGELAKDLTGHAVKDVEHAVATAE